ncbi:MAG TPA: ElyC/SanA/YdcF family protein [Dongiaceae bacterium]|nr:ElyC/SanA/YdcF family protein [Dongiaceae bacterium]
MRRGKLIIAALIASLILAFGATAGQILVVDSPQPSDLILVLAGETDHRPALALDLLKRGYGSRVLMDVPADAKIYEFSQIDLAKRYVTDLPEAASVSVCPIHGLSTRDESHDVARCITPEDGNRILIVTSDFHTHRALSIFRHSLPGKSFSVAASHDPANFGAHWWTHRQWAKTCVDEWLRVLWWNAVERWQ